MPLEAAQIMRNAAGGMQDAARTFSGSVEQLQLPVMREFEGLVQQQLRIAQVMVKLAGMQAANSQYPEAQPHNETEILSLLQEL